MSFAQFLNTVGKVAAATVVAAAKVQAQQNEFNEAHIAEDREAARWETRRQEALANIEDGLTRDTGTKWMNGLTSKQEQAIKLRADVNTHCRNRSESLMAYAEQRISSFQRSSW